MLRGIICRDNILFSNLNKSINEGIYSTIKKKRIFIHTELGYLFKLECTKKLNRLRDF